jgi:hypothetical protein
MIMKSNALFEKIMAKRLSNTKIYMISGFCHIA